MLPAPVDSNNKGVSLLLIYLVSCLLYKVLYFIFVQNVAGFETHFSSVLIVLSVDASLLS